MQAPNPESWDSPDPESTSAEERRKFQNRMAQRRFRKRAKGQQQVFVTGPPLPFAAPNENPDLLPQFPVPHSSQPTMTPWTDLRLDHGALSLSPMQSLADSDETLTPWSDCDGMYSFFESFKHEVKNLSDQVPRLASSHMESESDDQTNHSSITQHPQWRKLQNEDTIWILEKQREHLGSKAEEMVHQLINLYELGVSLNIFPVDLAFQQLLATLHTGFKALRPGGAHFDNKLGEL